LTADLLETGSGKVGMDRWAVPGWPAQFGRPAIAGQRWNDVTCLRLETETPETRDRISGVIQNGIRLNQAWARRRRQAPKANPRAAKVLGTAVVASGTGFNTMEVSMLKLDCEVWRSAKYRSKS
jgi:hypothetical protein